MISNHSGFELECIDGRDDFLRIPLSPIVPNIIGNGPDGAGRAVGEIPQDQGFLTFTIVEGRVLLEDGLIDGPELRVNGQPVEGNVMLGPEDIIRIGQSIWRVHMPANEAPKAAEKKPDRLQSFVGLERLEDHFSLSDLFGEVFRRKSARDMEDQLLTGTSRHKPALLDFEIGWARPWLFARFLAVSIVLGLVMSYAMNRFDNPLMLPGIMFIGTFAMPLSVLIFFMEMNTPRNISIFRIISALFAGGVASLVVTLFLFERLSLLSDILGASSAGIIEESAKLAVVIILFGRDDSFRWGQNGMLLGAAIGCGFAAFESAGYAFHLLVQTDFSLEAFSQNIIMRAVHSPFTHIIWTANAAAALWFVKGDKPFSISMLRKRLFVRVFVSSMLLHMLWNAPLGVFPIPVFLDLKYLLLGMLGLSISLRLIQLGLRQIMDARRLEIERLANT